MIRGAEAQAGFSRQAGPPCRRSECGFALLAVLAIICLGSSIYLMSAGENLRPNRQSQVAAASALNLAGDALIGFAIINGRLPCPARPDISTGTAGAGMADCTQPFGVLPWVTLGLPETDPWGRRYSYRVSSLFTLPFDSATLGDITVLNTVGGSALAHQVPAVIISHGKNGFHAWLPSGLRMGISPDGDENENNMANVTFVSKTQSELFDDLVVWIDRGELFDMMIKAGKF